MQCMNEYNVPFQKVFLLAKRYRYVKKHTELQLLIPLLYL